MSIALKVMSIDVVIGGVPPAEARAMAAIFMPAGGTPEAPVQAVLDACEFVEMESA